MTTELIIIAILVLAIAITIYLISRKMGNKNSTPSSGGNGITEGDPKQNEIQK